MIHWYVVGGVLVAGVIALLPVLKIVARVAPFAYPNARIRAMRAKLVKKEEFEALIQRPYTDVLYELRERIPSLGQLGSDISFGKIDSALREDLVDALLLLRRISPQSSKDFVSAIISKYDIQVIESIVRSQEAKINVKYDILHTTEVFSAEFIRKEFITIDDLQNELKNTMYAPILEKHLEEIKQHRYQAFEEELDISYFKRLLASAKTPDAKTYAKLLIDAHNISHALKGFDPIIPGGKIPREQLANKTVEHIVQAAKHASYDLTANTATELERGMQMVIKQQAKYMMAKDPLSEASIIGFIALKAITTRNTVIMLKMKSHNFTPERINEVLVI